MERHAQRWFRLWIFAGRGLAVLLLASTVINYVISEHTTVLFNTRREMAREMSALDQLVRDQKPATASLSGILDEVVQESHGSLAWAQILDREGAVIARSDAAAAPAFTADYVVSRIRERRPIFAVRDTSAGKVVVEAFPIRLPSHPSAASFKTVALKSSAGTMAFVELASFADAGVLAWPARWTLILGVTAGFALLGALTLLVARFRAHLSARRVERQIDIARQVQRGLLPAATSSPRDFDLAAEWRPAANVSGDFYDAFDLPEDGAAFVVGDVAGKDVPAAMLASVIQGTVHGTDWTRSAACHKAATEQLNRLLCDRASHERFASLFWGYFDARTGLLHYVNCGHCAPLLFRAGGQDVLGLSDGGPVLGLLPQARFEQGVERLERGDVLVLYSDGVIEAVNATGEEFGEQRLIAAVESCPQGEPAEIRDRILHSVRAFTGSDVLVDDQTLLAIRYRGAAVAASEIQAA
ncbi:MAG: PP2C family protein-serine/threonine phosphatase [Acidobacteriia bacterium]|nr:PP2C family protein-serine/threonine phosphatase [Terriglobia bacterium]